MADIDDLDYSNYEVMRDALLNGGYTEIGDYQGIRSGARVKHIGQRFNYTSGTATVLGVFEKDPSSWSQKYQTRDIEIIVRRDAPMLAGMSLLSQWANYHTELCETEVTT